MNLKNLFQEIESHEFAAYLGVTSNLNIFLGVAFQQEVVRALCKALDSAECLKEVILRVDKLSREPIDEKYENPSDTALGIYVWAIYLRDLSLGKITADIALKAPQTWWASRIARRVLQEHQAMSKSESDYYTFGIQTTGAVETKSRTNTSNSIEFLTISRLESIAIGESQIEREWRQIDPAILVTHNNVDVYQMRNIR